VVQLARSLLSLSLFRPLCSFSCPLLLLLLLEEAHTHSLANSSASASTTMPLLASLLGIWVKPADEQRGAGAGTANTPSPFSQPQSPSIQSPPAQSAPVAAATPSSQPFHPSAPASTTSPSPNHDSSSNNNLNTPHVRSSIFSKRSRDQLGIFLGGAGFLMISVLVSRRAVAKHMKAARMRYFQPNNLQGRKGTQADPKDPLIPIEALGLATLNVMSFGMMAAGGTAWALDISSIDDIRRMARRSIYGPAGRLDEDAEKQVAEWVANTLGLKLEDAEGGPVALPTPGGAGEGEQKKL